MSDIISEVQKLKEIVDGLQVKIEALEEDRTLLEKDETYELKEEIKKMKEEIQELKEKFRTCISDRMKAIAEHMRTPLIQEALSEYNRQYSDTKHLWGCLHKLYEMEANNNPYHSYATNSEREYNLSRNELSTKKHYFYTWYRSFPPFQKTYNFNIVPWWDNKVPSILPCDKSAFPPSFFYGW